jgi:hypothetical protein
MHEIPTPDRKGLREFGLVTGGIVAGLFGLFFPWLLGVGIPWWPWIVAAVLALWGLLAPDSLAPVYRGWMRVGLALSKVTTPIVLGLVFYLLFLPVGWVMRLSGKDPMARRLEPDAASYRVPSQRPVRESLERPF